MTSTFEFKNDDLKIFIEICDKIMIMDKSQQKYFKYLYFHINNTLSFEICCIISEYVINDMHEQWQKINQILKDSLVIYNIDPILHTSYMCLPRDVFRWVMNWSAQKSSRYEGLHPLIGIKKISEYYTIQDEIDIHENNKRSQTIEQRIRRYIKGQWLKIQNKIEDNNHNLVIFENKKIKLDDSQFCGCIPLLSYPFLIINEILGVKLDSIEI
jgi:hypothetical protein